jgi:two-component system sensor histidine kinase/response regulator
VAGRNGWYITKPIGLNDIEKTLTSLSPAPSAVPAGPSGKLVWGKAEALDRLGGDEALLLELCQIFLEESPKQLQKVRQAVAEADAQAVMRAAHCLKGELGYLGAAGASQAAQQLEDMGHENDLSHAAETLVVLEREMASLHLALKDPSGAIQ